MHEYIVRLFLFCMVLRFEISACPIVLALFQFFFFFFFNLSSYFIMYSLKR